MHSERTLRRRTAVSYLVTLLGFAFSALGGCPRPDDRLEPNDTRLKATPLLPGQAVEARVVQGNSDLFAITAGAGTTLRFVLDSIGAEEEECVALRLEGPEGVVLYDDNAQSCSRGLNEPIRAPGVMLTHSPGVGYQLVAPADSAGEYVLSVTELGHADNVFTYSWRYLLIASEE